ncbi:dipeptidase [Pontibacter harenae]|uniref:dipeptidase n=1 Tax=Pontibacter harenae TaxID=2894083 RepID=UPI001E48A075|nr:membrane dipeptidase [Pontibacter harenae]MCC9167747.1 membrane dipeptidase [Pontibacter harenae]
MAAPLPIIDLHCDLLVYLTDVPGSAADKVEEIGCAIPSLLQGNVRLQVMAIYSAVGAGSSNYARLQSKMFKELATADNCLVPVTDATSLGQVLQSSAEEPTIGVVAAIENASGFCEEDDDLEEGFKKLENIITDCGRILYISLTHHTPNRFGGGNMSDLGITTDGKLLLDYLHGRRIAVDLSHTSDALAHDILNHIDSQRLDIPILASHSNFRPVWQHNRNLPDELTQEIIRRQGLIGMNFLRAFVNNHEPEALLQHIRYGLENGAENTVCFGADYFYVADHPDQERFPFYFTEHEQAGISYNYILSELRKNLTPIQVEKIAFGNTADFIQRLWAI